MRRKKKGKNNAREIKKIFFGYTFELLDKEKNKRFAKDLQIFLIIH